jgi:hypothetical protein
MQKGNCMSSFSLLDAQEVLHLLHVSIMCFKEAKRTFLTPVREFTSRTGQKCLL